MQRPLRETERPLAFFRPSLPSASLIAALSAAALGLALYLRYGIIQNTPIGLACGAGEKSLTCSVRFAAIQLFNYDAFGWTAVIAACLQLWRPNLITFGIGLAAAAAGLALYNTRLSALAVTLLVLSLARARF
jgi:hypothetical protein